jgi:hypothetical protein
MQPSGGPGPCPRCSSADILAILYGFGGGYMHPVGRRIRETRKGRAVFGGCVTTGNDPRRCCMACGLAFDFGQAETVISQR